MKNEQMIKIGKRMAEVRTKLNLTQHQMADKLNISRAQYSKIERGLTVPNTGILLVLGTEFNISPDWLLAGKGQMIQQENNSVISEQDFGPDTGAVMEMLDIIRQVPMVKYAVLGHYLEYRKENNEIIEKTISTFKHYKKLTGNST